MKEKHKSTFNGVWLGALYGLTLWAMFSVVISFVRWNWLYILDWSPTQIRMLILFVVIGIAIGGFFGDYTGDLEDKEGRRNIDIIGNSK